MKADDTKSPAGQRFAQAIAGYLGCSLDRLTFYYKGRVGLYALLDAMDVQHGDEVILPAYTCVVVPNAVLYRNAVPRYIDIDLDSYSVTPDAVEAAIGPRTKVIICQNTYGLSSAVDTIVRVARRHGIKTIEDCAHGFGGTYKARPNGTWCDAAFFSCQWNKPFSTGVGGFVLANDDTLIPRLQVLQQSCMAPTTRTRVLLRGLLRFRGLAAGRAYYHMVELYRAMSALGLVPGSSSSQEIDGQSMPHDYLMGMSALQMRAGERALADLARINERRRNAGLAYSRALKGLRKRYVAEQYWRDHLFLKYPILVRDRDKFRVLARRANVMLGDWFTSPLHPVQGDLSGWGFDGSRYPNAAFAASHVVNLPTDAPNCDRVVGFLHRNASFVL